MGWGAAISLAGGIVGLLVMIYRWRMNANRIRKEEDEQAKSKRESVNEALKNRDVKKLNELLQEED